MTMHTLKERLPDFLQLMRADKPIGSLLLIWPTLWALWFAAEGLPDIKLLVIFVVGVFMMRSAGCVINDYADRNVDGHVRRTASRPMPSGKVSPKEAIALFVILCVASFVLVLLTNKLTIQLSFVGVALAFCYPFMKRYTHLPQLVLGAAFTWGVPMAFAAQANSLPTELWPLFITGVLWAVVYDTFYAMVDREDDLKIGIKSTAVLFGDMDIPITFTLQVMVIIGLIMTGLNFNRGAFYFAGVGMSALLFVHQQYLIQNRDRDLCFKAFLQNNRVGAAVFVGLLLDYHWPQ